ncbi:MAG: helix-turn-helix transcriptional regulator [Candidatus Peribacteraceae bacterium]|nr:helix-turn-helix transcriptional regulator [Candidatus Peribacteraceae bacterium]
MKNESKKSNFSKNLIKFRKLRGFSQEDLAKKTGYTHRMIAYYETKAVNPPLDKIVNLANILGVKITNLIETKENSKINEEIDFSKLDTRTIKKFKQILDLSPMNRVTVYKLVESLSKDKKS